MSEDGRCVEDPDQTVILKANFVISAFGSTAALDPQLVEALSPLKLKSSGYLDVDPTRMTTDCEWIFAGGDIAGVSETTVEAVNDGKTASWSIHRYLQVIKKK